MRPRRDPRAERAGTAVAGNKRPRFVFGLTAGTGRPRRDPRAEVALQTVAPAHRLRLDRTHRAAPGAVTAMRTEVVENAAPSIIVMDAPAFLVALVPDAPGGRLTAHDRQLFGAARLFTGTTGGVVALASLDFDGLGPAGADRVTPLPAQTGYDPDARAAGIAAAFRALSPRHLIFAESPEGGDLARRVALLLNEPLFSDVDLVSATILARPSHGRRTEQRGAPTRLLSLAPDATAPYAGAPREARPLEVTTEATVAGPTAILDARLIPADPASVPLALADFVTAAGNGIHDFEAFRALVGALGATLGASRVLCDAGLMPREAQVGASGTVLGATCYLALGIAGAPQHLQGIAGCEHVIAVNTDLHAAMVARAGLAIVGDAQRVMPALLAALAKEARP